MNSDTITLLMPGGIASIQSKIFTRGQHRPHPAAAEVFLLAFYLVHTY